MDKAESASTPQQFEQAIKKLETVIAQMEQGKLSLADSLAQYEQGIKLIRECQTALDNAEQTIKRLNETSS